MFLKQAVGRAINLGYDKVSDPSTFKFGPYLGEGILMNSGQFTGKDSREASSLMEKAGRTQA
jgi:hypothetical protein